MLVLLFFAGCSGPPVTLDESLVCESFVLERWLPFVTVGSTDKAIVERLGEPTEKFDDGCVFVYDLILSENDAESKKFYQYYTASQLQHVAPPVNISPFLYGIAEEKLVVHNERRKLLAARDDSLIVVRNDYESKNLWQTVGREAEYSLVCVFDDSRTLQNFSLLRIRP